MERQKPSVYYLGPEGTNTEHAVRAFGQLFGFRDASYVPLATFPDIIRSVSEANGDAAYGCLALENSIHGSVILSWDSLFKRAGLLSPTSNFADTRTFAKPPEVQIEASITLPIRHTLLSLRAVADSVIETVYSHPQALAQCHNWLEQHMPQARLVAVESTAEGARRIAELGEASAAAICHISLADRYQLHVLHDGVQDVEQNFTRFGFISSASTDMTIRLAAGHYTTALCLCGVANSPGGLWAALQPFQEEKLNLSRIESRPQGDVFGIYRFYVDITSAENPSSAGQVAIWQRLLGKLSELGVDVYWLGTYPELQT